MENLEVDMDPDSARKKKNCTKFRIRAVPLAYRVASQVASLPESLAARSQRWISLITRRCYESSLHFFRRNKLSHKSYGLVC